MTRVPAENKAFWFYFMLLLVVITAASISSQRIDPKKIKQNITAKTVSSSSFLNVIRRHSTWWNAPLKVILWAANKHREEEQQARWCHAHHVNLLHLCRSTQRRQEPHVSPVEQHEEKSLITAGESNKSEFITSLRCAWKVKHCWFYYLYQPWLVKSEIFCAALWLHLWILILKGNYSVSAARSLFSTQKQLSEGLLRNKMIIKNCSRMSTFTSNRLHVDSVSGQTSSGLQLSVYRAASGVFR